MTLRAGKSLGPYEIVAPIGAGGMGEVYKARDTRLDRIVAIKVSQERFSERFEREARAIAALNHPHICQLYDVGPDFLVMEYVEGKPISGPLALTEVLRIAAQITEALDAAHTNGVVHRDLKPDNILITKSGAVKLLDFGLAKLAVRAGPSAAEEIATRPLTAQGSIVGTLQYMSPEQLQGKEVDSRSDIFSFGAVLYEMLTGRRAFDGANPASIVAAILTAQPAPLSALDPLSPPTLDRVLRRCLAKDPEARWQSIRDVGAALECVSENTMFAGAAPQSRIRALGPWLAALFAMTTFGLGGAFILRGNHDAPRIVKFNVPTQFGAYQRPVLSPDGSRVAFISGDTRLSQLWVRSLSSFEAQRIEGAETIAEPIWSPDSKQIAVSVRGKLNRFDLTGQTPTTICDVPDYDSSGGSWSSSGTILFPHRSAIYRVAASGGEIKAVTRVDRSHGELFHTMPYFLPDARRFLFMAVNQRTEDSAVYQGALDSPQVQRVIANPVGPVYVIGNDLIFVRGTTLMRQPFDWKTARVKGEPVSLQEQVYAYTGSFNPMAAFSVSADTLAYHPAGLLPTQLVWFDREGNRLSSLGAVAQYTNPALSPDQKHVAVGITDPRTNQRDVWLFDSLGGGMRLTSDPKDDFNPTWSPDGSHIAFVSDRRGVRDLFIKPASGLGAEEVLLASADQKAAESWTPDGKFLLYNNEGTIRARAIQGQPKDFAVVEGLSRQDQAAISPDGKWIAFRAIDAGGVEVFLQSFPVGGTRWQLSTSGGGEPSWRRDGKELYFVRDKQLFAVEIKVTAAGVEHGAPKLLFTAPFTAEIRRNRYVPASDGQRFLVVAQAEGAGLQAHIVVNWRAALKKD